MKTVPKQPGRQFTRRTVAAVAPDGVELYRIDQRDNLGSIEQRKQAAIEQLVEAGIPARAILAEDPGGSMLRDYVLNHEDHEPDSAVGLAARICEQCIRLQELPARGADSSMLIGEAYRLGRLVTLADVYETQHRTAIDAAEAERKPGIETRAAILTAWNDDVAAKKPRRGRIKRIAATVGRKESTVRSGLRALLILGKIRDQRR